MEQKNKMQKHLSFYTRKGMPERAKKNEDSDQSAHSCSPVRIFPTRISKTKVKTLTTRQRSSTADLQFCCRFMAYGPFPCNATHLCIYVHSLKYQFCHSQ